MPPVVLANHTSVDELRQEAEWLADMVRLWLDEEWLPLDVHGDVGRATAQAYVKLRRQGASEAGDVLLGLGTELLGFDFSETFTSGFDVGNKSVELLMLRQGIAVCCTTEADRQAIQRYERQLEEEAARRQ